MSKIKPEKEKCLPSAGIYTYDEPDKLKGNMGNGGPIIIGY